MFSYLPTLWLHSTPCCCWARHGNNAVGGRRWACPALNTGLTLARRWLRASLGNKGSACLPTTRQDIRPSFQRSPFPMATSIKRHVWFCVVSYGRVSRRDKARLFCSFWEWMTGGQIPYCVLVICYWMRYLWKYTVYDCLPRFYCLAIKRRACDRAKGTVNEFHKAHVLLNVCSGNKVVFSQIFLFLWMSKRA